MSASSAVIFMSAVYADRVYGGSVSSIIAAAGASGSFHAQGMAGIHSGYSDNLVLLAADVMMAARGMGTSWCITGSTLRAKPS